MLFLLMHFPIFNLIAFEASVILQRHKKNIKNIKTLLDIIRRNEFKLRRVPDFLDTFNTKCEQRMFDLCSPKIFLLQ